MCSVETIIEQVYEPRRATVSCKNIFNELSLSNNNESLPNRTGGTKLNTRHHSQNNNSTSHFLSSTTQHQSSFYYNSDKSKNRNFSNKNSNNNNVHNNNNFHYSQKHFYQRHNNQQQNRLYDITNNQSEQPETSCYENSNLDTFSSYHSMNVLFSEYGFDMKPVAKVTSTSLNPLSPAFHSTRSQHNIFVTDNLTK